MKQLQCELRDYNIYVRDLLISETDNCKSPIAWKQI